MNYDGEVRLRCFVNGQSGAKDIAPRYHNGPPTTDMIEELVAHNLLILVNAHMHCNQDHHGVH